MSATLRLSRSFRVADAAWPYSIVVDSHTVGKLTNRDSTKIQLVPGTHTLQILTGHKILSRLRFSSPTVTLHVSDDETADFICHSRPFPQIIYWLIAALRGPRSRWIVLQPAKEAARIKSAS
jgi:hypothetical protein